MDPNEVPSIRPQRKRRRPDTSSSASSNPSSEFQLTKSSTEKSTPQPRSTAQVIPPRKSQTTSITPKSAHPSPVRLAPSSHPSSKPRQTTPHTRTQKKHRNHQKWLLVPVLIIALLIAWPLFLYHTTSNELTNITALSDKPETAGTTYLIAGSDKRGDRGGIAEDGTEGERTDSMILVHKAENGNVSVISLPRDADVAIPGHERNKLNAAFSYGGATLLVETVERLSGLKVDHFIIIGMGGVANIVDSMGGINLCLDYDVKDKNSRLNWKSGCHDANGQTALAFARMRYADPRGDLGRQERQRQVISKVVKKAFSTDILINPMAQYDLGVAGAQSITVDSNSGLYDIGQLALAYRTAVHNGTLGTPPIRNLNYRAGHGSSVQLDPKLMPIFFKKVANGTAKPEDFNRITAQ